METPVASNSSLGQLADADVENAAAPTRYGSMPMAAVLTGLLMATTTALKNPWRMRGAYPNRPGMPAVQAVAASCGVAPPLMTPKWVWATAWRSSKRVIPLCHRWDPVAPADTCVNLLVVWLKALSGNRRDGLADGGISYAFLPSVTRWIVSPVLAWLYPRLHHQNIAMRSAFLERAVAAELSTSEPTALVTLGAGFDGRSLRFATKHRPCVELDLPQVIEQKRGLVARATRRLPQLVEPAASITYLGANLSDVTEARAALKTAMTHIGRADTVVVICEALLIYLPTHSATELLRSAVEEAQAAGARHVSVCFADALPGVKGVARADAEAFLSSVGLVLDAATWTPKPGLARHMGVARAGSS